MGVKKEEACRPGPTAFEDQYTRMVLYHSTVPFLGARLAVWDALMHAQIVTTIDTSQ